MKCCCSYTVGMLLGCLYFGLSGVYLIFGIVSLLMQDYYTVTEEMNGIIFAGVMFITSHLLIVAIKKRIHYLIIPWLLFNIYILVITLGALYSIGPYFFIVMQNRPSAMIAYLIICLITVIEITGTLNGCFLLQKICQENNEECTRQESEAILV